MGSGAVDLVFIPGLFSNIDHNWAEPGFARFLRRLATFSRLIVVAPRGTGLSDRAQRHPPMEEQVDDMLSVLDAMGSRSAAFFGFSQAGPSRSSSPPPIPSEHEPSCSMRHTRLLLGIRT